MVNSMISLAILLLSHIFVFYCKRSLYNSFPLNLLSFLWPYS